MNKKGFAYFYALLFALLIAEFALCVKIYRDQGAYMVDYESESYIASSVAESGVNCALSEINYNFEWKTHEMDETELRTNGKFVFTDAVSPTPTINLKGNDDIDIKMKDNKYNGTIKLWEGQKSTFKVKCGVLPVYDNPNTDTDDESKIFLYIKSVASFGDKFRAVDAVVQTAFANKYIIYDGKDALICFGSSDSSEKTYVANGEIYGKEHVLLGTPEGGSSPELVIENIDSVSTGKDGYICMAQSDGNKITINNDQKDVTNEKIGDFKRANTKAKEVLNAGSDDPEDFKIETFNGIFKDKYTGGRDFDLDFDGVQNFYKNLAKGIPGHGEGIYIKDDTVPTANWHEYKNNKYYDQYKGIDNSPSASKFEVVFWDLGHAVMGDGSDSDDFGPYSENKLPKSLKPSDFNGVIYSEVPLVIWGNPDRDLIIYSEQDIFIAGDFNQRHTSGTLEVTYLGGKPQPVRQNYKSNKAIEYMDVNGKTLPDVNEAWRTSNPSYYQGVYWNNVDVISEQRIWNDYTDPRKFAKNEIIPLIRFEIYSELFRKVNGSSNGGTDEVCAFGSGESGTVWEAARYYGNLLSGNPEDYDLKFTDQPSFTSGDSVIGTIFNVDNPTDSTETDDDLVDTFEVSSIFNGPDKTLKSYFKDVLKFDDSYADELLEKVLRAIIEKESGERVLHRKEIDDIVRQDIWKKFVDDGIDGLKAFVRMNTGEGLVGRLYGITNFKTGAFKQSFSAGDENDQDDLYIPEMTVNCKRITMGVLVPNIGPTKKSGTTQRWDCDVEKIDAISSSAEFSNFDTIKKVMTIREVLGNSNNDNGGSQFLTDAQVATELDDGYFRYILPDHMFIRTYGSEMCLRNMTDVDRLPYLSGGYGQHIRKKIFDKNNRTKYELRSFNLLKLRYYNISKKEYEGF